MKVKDLVYELKAFDPEMEVIISDGLNFKFYRGNFAVIEFDCSVDIGIGGCEFEGEINEY